MKGNMGDRTVDFKKVSEVTYVKRFCVRALPDTGNIFKQRGNEGNDAGRKKECSGKKERE